VAPTGDDRFYGEYDAGDAVQKLAESCDYRQLRDKRSALPPADDWWGIDDTLTPRMVRTHRNFPRARRRVCETNQHRRRKP